MVILDPQDFNLDYWTPAPQMREHDYRLWLAEKLAHFSSEVAATVEHFHPAAGEPSISEEAVHRLLDSGMSPNDKVPTGVLDSHLVQDAIYGKRKHDTPK